MRGPSLYRSPVQQTTADKTDSKVDKKEDEAGVTTNITTPKVMKDGAVNKTQAAKIAKNKADFAKLTDAEKKALQVAADAKRKKFEDTPEYKARKKAADAKTKKANSVKPSRDQYKDVKFAGDDGMDKN